MVIYSVTDAAFAGYRLLRERPRAILAWAAFQTVAAFLFAGLMLALSAPQMANFQTLVHPDPANPAAALHAMVALGPMFLLLLVYAVAVSAVMQSAAYRAFLRPSDSRWGYLRLGGDEGRMAALMAILGVLLVLFILVLTFVWGMVVAMGAVLPGLLRGLVQFLAFAAACGAIAYVFVRFSLAAPATFAEQRLQVMRSWRMTEGHVWQLFVAYLLMFISLLIVLLLLVMVFAALMGAAALSSGGDLAQVAGALRGESAAAMPLPMLLLNLVFSVVQLWLGAASVAVQIGPSAESYRELAGMESSPATVFS